MIERAGAAGIQEGDTVSIYDLEFELFSDPQEIREYETGREAAAKAATLPGRFFCFSGWCIPRLRGTARYPAAMRTLPAGIPYQLCDIGQADA